jgi:hypothetical protein
LKSPHFLRAASNVRQLKQNLVQVLEPGAIDTIEAHICLNAAQLYNLGRNHYLFAIRQNNRAWRQKVSRLYYGAYNASRAVRLCVSGDYAVDSSDHKKIGDLPSDFHNHATYKNRLSALRDDRNLCDYDHTASISDLVVGIADSAELIRDFLQDARDYLRARGVRL